MNFYKQRRQQFLTEAAYKGELESFRTGAVPTYLGALARPPRDAIDHTLNADNYADESFSLYLLRYTGGESIPILREDLDHVVLAYEQSARYAQEFQGDPSFPPLRFAEIDDYERVLQLIGLCFLLHRRDLLPRISAIFDPSFAGQDTLYEDMLSFELEDRYEVDQWHHEAYRDIINSLYRDTEAESIVDIENYLRNWYKSLSKAPWHDRHLEIEDDMCAGYFGCWAIEAGAIAYLLELNDESFRENLVYPKDLVDYARNADIRSDTSANRNSENHRVAGGEVCPQSGYWMTPAQLNSRRLFKVGEIMPIFANSPYGATIWQWSQQQ